MLRGDHSVTIGLPAEHVFRQLVDGRINMAWRGSVVETSPVSGDGGEDTVWRLVVNGPGRFTAEAEHRVTVCEPPTRYVYQIVAGLCRGTAAYTLTAHADGSTTVHLECTLQAHGLARLFNGIVPRLLAIELGSLDRHRLVLLQPPGSNALEPDARSSVRRTQRRW
jgi:uncharacterized protein YndB with AHSA1/START domain